MSSLKSEMDFNLFDKDDMSLKSTLFPDIHPQKFKEELFPDELPLEWNTSESGLGVDDILDFVHDDLPAAPSSAVYPSAAFNMDESMTLKQEDLDSFRDLVNLPFEDVMDSFSSVGFDTDAAASDSGVSTGPDGISDGSPNFSPCSMGGGISPEPRGDISVDTFDASSEVSYGDIANSPSSPTSFTGSSGGSSPCLGESMSPNVISSSVGMPSLTIQQLTQNGKNIFVPISSIGTVRTSSTIATTPSRQLTLTSKNLTTFSQPLQKSIQPVSIATRSIKLDLNGSNAVSRLVKSSNSSVGSPVVTKVRLEAPLGGSKGPQTIVVAPKGKNGAATAAVMRGGALMKASNGAASGRSILLPVSVNDLNQVRTIKIISTGSSQSNNVRTVVSSVRPARPVTSVNISSPSTRTTTFYTTSTKGLDGRALLKVTPTALVNPTSRLMDDDSDDEELPPHTELVLTDEERKLMKKESLILPARYPLTKQEERDLKRIRRKIRNKISAQDSRKRKKEYVDGLEDRVKICSDENQQLQKRIKTLEKQNESLVSQLKKIQSLVGGSYGRGHNNSHSTSTALMMLILSAALVVVPSLRSNDSGAENELKVNAKMHPSGHSRSLLEARSTLGTPMEGLNSVTGDEEDPLTLFSPALSDHDYAPAAKKVCLCPPSAAPASTVAPPIKGLRQALPDDGGGDVTGFKGMTTFFTAVLNRLASATNPVVTKSAINMTVPATPPIVVNLPAPGRRLCDDIELE